MLAARIVLLLALLPTCAFSPGFFIVRKLHWNPLEKFCGSIGLSFILLYLVSFGIYWASPPESVLLWTAAAWGASASCVVLAAMALRDAQRLAACHQVRRVLLGFLFLLIWTLAILLLIRNYSGGGWSGDWQEHFQRTLFFLRGFPEWTPIFPDYELPARPPMMNLLGAFFLAQAGDRFDLFQIVFAFLNLLVFLPCCLIAPAIAKSRRSEIVPLVALFALNPMVSQNVTYTWTKLFAAFYVILGLSFYLAAWRKASRSRMTAAFVALSAGILVHYSAVPYFLFVTLHYLTIVLCRQRARWRELMTAIALSGTLMGTWFTWSTVTYGARSTFASNSSAKSALGTPGSKSARIAKNFSTNLYRTIVPHPLRPDVHASLFAQPNRAGRIRDYVFLIYQTNAIFGMGLIGGPVILFLVCRGLRWRHTGGIESQNLFWLLFPPFCLILGIAVHPGPDLFGVAQVTLQPLILLGLTLLAGRLLSLKRLAVAAVVIGSLTDFGLGVILHTRVQSYENTPDQTVFQGLIVQNGQINVGAPLDQSLSNAAWTNWFRKHQWAACNEWLQELSPYAGAATEAVRSQLERFRREDELYWNGWYERNGGSLVFLGDSVAATPMGVRRFLTIFVLGVLVILGAWLRETMPGRRAKRHIRAQAPKALPELCPSTRELPT
jgi:hypothetical protein